MSHGISVQLCSSSGFQSRLPCQGMRDRQERLFFWSLFLLWAPLCMQLPSAANSADKQPTTEEFQTKSCQLLLLLKKTAADYNAHEECCQNKLPLFPADKLQLTSVLLQHPILSFRRRLTTKKLNFQSLRHNFFDSCFSFLLIRYPGIYKSRVCC